MAVCRVFVCFLCGCLFLGGCFSFSPGEQSAFSLSTHDIQLGPEDQEVSFAISFSASARDRGWEVRGVPAWLTLSSTEGTDAAVIAVEVNRTGLQAGDYQATLLVVSGGQSEFIDVTLMVL